MGGEETGGSVRSVLAVMLSALMLHGAPGARAQVPELSTDRPDLTESAALVPSGLWQVESGFARERMAGESGDVRRLSVAEMLVRVGLSEVFEARIGGGYIHQREGASSSTSPETGLAGVMAGVKLRLGEGFAALAHIHLPIGNTNLRLPDVAPELVLAAETPLNSWLELSGNVGGLWLQDEAGVFATAALGADLTEPLGAFVEGFWGTAMGETPLLQAEGGLTYLLASNLQLDCTGGVTLFDSDPGWFLGAGVSVRFPR